MPKRSSTDTNKLAFQIVQEATKPKNEHAVALGRIGGLKGGPARAKKLSEKRRRDIARRAAEARWGRS